MQVNKVNVDGQHGEAWVTFLSDDPLFRGHFEEEPILPGVALIDAVVQILSQVKGRELRLKKLKFVKFFQVVKPDQHIALTFDWEKSDGNMTVQARWDFSKEQKVASLACELAEEGT
jgi:3-hydroxymyristoyl/3-hydroxydecanoyl-(acyl carrier protein) dehydratase